MKLDPSHPTALDQLDDTILIQEGLLNGLRMIRQAMVGVAPPITAATLDHPSTTTPIKSTPSIPSRPRFTLSLSHRRAIAKGRKKYYAKLRRQKSAESKG